MQTRGVSALNKYWDAIEKFFWKRFKYLLNLHVESVRTTDPSKLGAIETRPHYVTRRYAGMDEMKLWRADAYGILGTFAYIYEKMYLCQAGRMILNSKF